MESEFFIDEIVRTLRKITQDLTPQQVRALYDSSNTSFEVKYRVQERLIAELCPYQIKLGTSLRFANRMEPYVDPGRNHVSDWQHYED